MALNNPFAGPDFLTSLCIAIEKNKVAFMQPPKTGGAVTSLRFPEHLLAYFDAIGAASGWNRNQVIYALLNKGLYDMFNKLESNHAEKIINEVIRQVESTLSVS